MNSKTNFCLPEGRPGRYPLKTKNYILLGLPGSGKGAQAERLAKKLRGKIIAAGEIARKLSKQNNEQGQRVRERIKKGILIQDKDLIPAIEKEVANTPVEQSIIFDAFPRNLSQTKALEKILKRTNRAEPKVLFLKISEITAQKRITGRRICEKCGNVYKPPESLNLQNCSCGGRLITRSDDQPEAIAKRLKIYQKETLPILEHYRQKGQLLEIDGEPSIEKVWNQIEQNIQD